jgi:hypothetical protein
MPTFNQDTEIDVEVDDFVSSCSKREIKELIEILVDEGHLNKSSLPHDINIEKNVLDLEWDILCDKLLSLRLRLTVEEEETIKKIINKY